MAPPRAWWIPLHSISPRPPQKQKQCDVQGEGAVGRKLSFLCCLRAGVDGLMGLLAPPTPVPSLLLQGYPSSPFSRPFTLPCCLHKAQHSPNLPNANRFFVLTLLPSGTPLCYPEGDGVGAGLPRTSCSVWGLDFVRERFHHMSPGDLERTFFKAEDRTRKGLRWRKQQESEGGLPQLSRGDVGQRSAPWKGRERGPWRRVQGVSLG